MKRLYDPGYRPQHMVGALVSAAEMTRNSAQDEGTSDDFDVSMFYSLGEGRAQNLVGSGSPSPS